MIPRSADWKHALATAVRDPAELIALLDLPRELIPAARESAQRFSLRVPRAFLARMQKGDPDDPLLHQVLPRAAENLETPGFVADPVGDMNARRGPGVLQKYRGRALLVTTGACAVHCRFCFRRHFPYGEENASQADFGEALALLAADGDIREVILSGGDPLMLDDERLGTLVQRLARIAHLERLRIHSRLPVVLPERVTGGLIQALTGSRLPCVMVVHANHANELDAAAIDVLKAMKAAGITLLNQSVLLAGINDDEDRLAALSEALFAAGVLPYYLHMLDPVSGAAHFNVDETHAIDLMERLRARLPGYLLPRLVREIAGAPGKTPVTAKVENPG
ncbi:MAG: EF-P beta-lysylation protein EpmB [Thiohalomonadaceae bacterium]